MAEKKKLKSKKLYRVPNPKTCTDFYSRGALLPKDYYGEEYYRKLRDSQLRKKSSTFVDDRIQSLEVANELEQ